MMFAMPAAQYRRTVRTDGLMTQTDVLTAAECLDEMEWFIAPTDGRTYRINPHTDGAVSVWLGSCPLSVYRPLA